MEGKVNLKILVPFLIVNVLLVLFIVKNMNIGGIKTIERTIKTDESVSVGDADAEAPDFGLTLKDYGEYAALKTAGLPAIVDIGSDTCAACRRMASALRNVNEEYAGRAYMKYADVSDLRELGGDVYVYLTPTQVFMLADGSPYVPGEELAKKLQFTVYSDEETGKPVLTLHEGYLSQEALELILAEMGVSDDD